MNGLSSKILSSSNMGRRKYDQKESELFNFEIVQLHQLITISCKFVQISYFAPT